VLVVINSDRK